jgi:WD40 repeat protein
LISGASDGDKFWETMRRWDVSSGKSKVIFNGPERGDVLSVTFSPDGKTIASGSADKMIRLWDMPSDKQMKK